MGQPPGRAPRRGGHGLGTSAALVSSSSAYRALWSGPFIKLVNISAEFVSPPKVNICAEFNFNLTSSCLQRLPCLCVCVCACVCFPCVLPRGSMLAGRHARGVQGACVRACTRSRRPERWQRRLPAMLRAGGCRGSTVRCRARGRCGDRVCGQGYKCNPQTSAGGGGRRNVPRVARDGSRWGRWLPSLS